MEKITQKLTNLPHDASCFSLEFFPPKTRSGFSNLQVRLERMFNNLRPLFVTVTWGAGGSTSSRSLELAEICQRQLGITTCLHLTCTNMKRRIVDEALEEAKAMGIRNILALRGDPPRTTEYGLDIDADETSNGIDSNEEFTWAVDLIRYIRQVHGDYFCIGVAGYPEGHADQSHPTDQDPVNDIPSLVEKIEAGGDFIMTQLFYDLDAYTKYEKMLREHSSGRFKNIPIIPGLMPIQSFAILKRTTKLAHVGLPADISRTVENVRGDDDAVKRVGVDVISNIVSSIKKAPSPLPRPFHFYTLNLEKAVSEIIERCDLIPPDPDASSTVVDDARSELHDRNGPETNGITPAVHTQDRSMSVSSAHAATEAMAQLTSNSHRSPSSSATAPPPLSTLLDPSKPSPFSNSNNTREATWDDYPNGRFGDARSPAYNPPLTYSPTSLTVSPRQAVVLWGTPSTHVDITRLFLSHLSGSSPSQLPWSESATLSPETALIEPQLSRLTREKGYWTIASQPAVDGVPSSHEIFGWGPPGGFVFQKAFVEFFVDAEVFNTQLIPKFDHLAKEEGELSYYAVNAEGDFISSDDDAVHAVTWGSFKGKEIATATMVEQVSFRQWGEEAFAIWAEWARCVGEVAAHLPSAAAADITAGHPNGTTPSSSEDESSTATKAPATNGTNKEQTESMLLQPSSATPPTNFPKVDFSSIDKDSAKRCKTFLSEMRRSVWLVNVIGHGYRDAGRLWELLLV